MKNIKQALICWRGTAACVSGSLLMLAGLNAVAQPFASPVGDWDVVMSGSRVGVARFTFNGDHTISASEVMIPKEFITKPKDTRGLDDSRNTTGDDGRNGITVTNTPLPPHTNQFGFVGFPSPVFVPELDSTQPEVNFTNSDGSAVWIHNGNPPGHWNFDLSGRIVGFFTELSSP